MFCSQRSLYTSALLPISSSDFNSMAEAAAAAAAEEKDIISTLPDTILCHILSFLETDESVSTSILSKRWKPLYRSVPSLIFNVRITDYVSHIELNDFVYSVLLSVDATLPIHTFHFNAEYYNSVHCPKKSITKWVNFVVQRNVQYIYLNVEDWIKFPITILTCKTLVVLKLFYVNVEQGFSSILLPSLKILHFKHICFSGLQDFMLFLKGCPVLEDLFTSSVSVYNETFKDDDQSLLPASVLTKLSQANIDCLSHYFPLKAVYNVKYLRFEFRQGYYHDHLFPTFHNLTQLKLICGHYTMQFVVDVLNHCPKLQSFDFDEPKEGEEVCSRRDDKEYWLFPDVVPQCLSLHLRTCNLLSFLGLHTELMLVKYILKNARVLQTMEIWNGGKPEIKRILSEFPRASATCKLTLMMFHR